MSVRRPVIFLALLALCSCVTERTVVENDDLYVWRRHEVPTSAYVWRGYHDRKYTDPDYLYIHPFVRPRWYHYPYWNQPSTVIVVPKQENNYQPGKRPDRGNLPGQNRNLTKPGRGRN